MCGLTGFFELGREEGARIGIRMAEAIRHRGPDDDGIWDDPMHGIVLAHRRLSVQDISQAGHQPMVSPTGRYVAAFNGEIYNHMELRSCLTDVRWQGHSDTETLLAAIDAWGLKKAMESFVGMFAFALWDREQATLILARDRLGEKPLYYGWQGKAFIFGSELNALRQHPAWQGDIDRGALGLYVRYGFVPVPFSIYAGIRKLAPGHFLQIHYAETPGTYPVEETYWSARQSMAQVPSVVTDTTEAIDVLENLIRRSVRRQLLSDVPLGAFLSGGVDSSTIVAMMQAEASTKVKTYSIGFLESNFNEAKYAKAVATYLGTEHTEYNLTASDALATIPQMPNIYDEPFGDSSQIPTYLVSSLARRDVTVCLSGDGGDELFGGYPRYIWGQKIWGRIGPLPPVVRRLAARTMHFAGTLPWRGIADRIPYLQDMTKTGDRLEKLAGMVDVKDIHELHARLLTQHRQSDSIVLGLNGEPTAWAEAEARLVSPQSSLRQLCFNDLVGYLSDDILVKVDRAAMAVALEVRVPFLDHHIVEFSLTLPDALKFRDGQTKWILRQALYRQLPAELVDRPKQGFSLPLGEWLRGPLREWADNLLNEPRILAEGFFDPAPIRRRWKEHLSGDRDWQHWLWNVLMFQAWYERWHG